MAKKDRKLERGEKAVDDIMRTPLLALALVFLLSAVGSALTSPVGKALRDAPAVAADHVARDP